MKNINLLIYIFIPYFLFSNLLFSEEVEFEAKNMDIKENGNLIVGINSKTKIPSDNVDIISDEVNFYKKKNLLIFKDNVLFYDKTNNIIIKSNKLSYKRDSKIIYSEGPTKLNIDDKYNITSEDISYNSLLQKIYGTKETIVEDNERNIINIENWVMSCRVFNRYLEEFVINFLITNFKHNNKKIIFNFKKNLKNKILLEIFDNIGCDILKDKFIIHKKKFSSNKYKLFSSIE